MVEQALLVKFGKYEHLILLQQEGLLYMHNLPYFWKIEDKELRGDDFDGVPFVARGCKGKIKSLDGTEWSVKVTNWILRIKPNEPEKINIFCMYTLRPSAGTFPVDEKNFRFGDHALVVTHPQQFIDRVCLHLKSQSIKGRADLVEYVDNGYTGKLGEFIKFNRFAYQSEWRMVCFDGTGDVRKLYIGSIKDISIIIPSNEINEKAKKYLAWSKKSKLATRRH